MFSLNSPKFYLRSKEGGLLAPTLINMEWLSLQPILPFLTHVLPAHLLYRSLMAHGFEDSLEVIEWIRGDQLQKILDFDIWEKSNEFDVEDICAHKVVSWFQAWLAIGPEFAAQRFLELEEETICLILSKIFHIIPEGVSTISEDVRENWWLTPDNKFFLRILENAEESFEILKPFVESLYSYNVRLAGSLFAYSCMLVRQETLEQGLRWRAGRLADEGFVPLEQAREVLRPKPLTDLKKTIEEAKLIQEKKKESANHISKSFLIDSKSSNRFHDDSEVFDSIVKLLTSFEPKDGAKFISLALKNENLKSLVGSQNELTESLNQNQAYFARTLEQLYDDEEVINEAAELLVAEAKNVILNLEFRNNSQEEPRLLIEKVMITLVDDDKQKLSHLKESISYLTNCVATVLESKWNDAAIGKSVLITRGAMNIGLELCLKMPEEYGLSLNKSSEVFNAIQCLETLGANFLFHLGWNLLFKVELKLAEKLVDLDANNLRFKGKLKTLRSIEFTDGTRAEVSLDKLVQALRFPEVSSWLCSCEEIFSTEFFFTLKALFHRVPQYSKILNEFSSSVTRETKPFETLTEVNSVFNFIENLNENLNHIDGSL